MQCPPHKSISFETYEAELVPKSARAHVCFHIPFSQHPYHKHKSLNLFPTVLPIWQVERFGISTASAQDALRKLCVSSDGALKFAESCELLEAVVTQLKANKDVFPIDIQVAQTIKTVNDLQATIMIISAVLEHKSQKFVSIAKSVEVIG